MRENWGIGERGLQSQRRWTLMGRDNILVCVWGEGGWGGGWDPPQSTRQNLDHLWRGLFSNVFLKPYSLKKTSKTLLHWLAIILCIVMTIITVFTCQAKPVIANETIKLVLKSLCSKYYRAKVANSVHSVLSTLWCSGKEIQTHTKWNSRNLM